MPKSDKHFHFTGICGTAMGAVAAAMKERGYKITGSDSAVYPPSQRNHSDRRAHARDAPGGHCVPTASSQPATSGTFPSARV